MKKETILPSFILLILLVGCAQQPASNIEESAPFETYQSLDNTSPAQAQEENNATVEEYSEDAQVEEDELSFEEKVWQQRIDAAFKPSNCKQVSGPKYGSLYYTGSLIDTHYHIPDLPDYPPGETNGEADPVFPSLGENIKITDIVCTLGQEGTKKVFAFFPVFPEISEQLLEVANKTMQLYPKKFVPFIMPPDNDNDPDGFPTVNAKVLREMLNVYPNLFRGYGEIGLYERKDGAAELPPDSTRLKEIYPVIREHELVVYFHLGEGQKDSFEKVLEQNPDINFIFHGDQLIDYEGGRQNLEDIGEIIGNYPNVFYTVDELYGDEWMIRPDKTKEEFLAYLEDHDALIREDLDTWKGIIERHPDQFMWGTDRSPQVVWSHDPEVGQALANYGRAFIARLDPAVQEKFAYKNAERLLSSS